MGKGPRDPTCGSGRVLSNSRLPEPSGPLWALGTNLGTSQWKGGGVSVPVCWGEVSPDLSPLHMGGGHMPRGPRIPYCRHS